MGYKLERKPGRNSSTRGNYGYPSKPTGITIHHWGSDGQKHDNVVSWLRGYGGNRASSAHEVISAGRVTLIVEHSRAAWHSGNTRGNGSTIGLEMRPEMSAGDWATLVERCADLEEEHGSLKYFKHSDWKATACPGRYGDRIGELVEAINAEHARRKGGGSKPKPKPKPKPAGKAPPFPLPAGHWYGTESRDPRNHSGYWKDDRAGIRQYQEQMKNVRGWRAMPTTGRFDAKTREVTIQFQSEKRLRVDGGVGPEVWAAAWSAPIT